MQPAANNFDIPEAPRRVRELSNASGALQLAADIEAYWRKRGHPEVRAWVEAKAHGSEYGSIYTVATNLVRGLPPGSAHG